MERQIESLQDAVKQLTGALNAHMEQTKMIERRLQKLEQPRSREETTNLASPQNAEDLKEISRLPDCVKELQPFDGNPTQYLSWVHSVENILRDYNIMRDRPIYRAILQSIRQKIRGNADSALISYNIFDDEWAAIKKCLSLHYADKRDLRTLEYQLGNLSQRNRTIDEFYANVNHQFSLIVNKIKTEDYSTDTVTVLIETYRNRALDVFIRGLNGDLSKMLIIQKPMTLPEAYASCLEIQNLNYRNLTVHDRNSTNSITAPINQIFARTNVSQNDHRRNPNQMALPQKNQAYNIQHRNIRAPPRPTQAKPAEQMDIDPSISRQVNYINRPVPQAQLNLPTFKRENSYHNEPRKQQRIYNMETQEEEDQYTQMVNENADIEDSVEYEEGEENAELNFMLEASLAYLT